MLTKFGRNDEAIKVFQDLLKRFADNDEVVKLAHSSLSIIYVNQGDYAKGEAELEILFQKTPDDPGLNNDLGYLYAEQGKNLEKAESMIRKAVQEEPDKPAYLDSLGWVLFKRGKVKEALEPLQKAVELQKLEEKKGRRLPTRRSANIWATSISTSRRSTSPADLGGGRADRRQGRARRQAAAGDSQEARVAQSPGPGAQVVVDPDPLSESTKGSRRPPVHCQAQESLEEF